MVFEKLTLVELHLETDSFEPSATASIGGGESGAGGKRPAAGRGGPRGRAKLAPVLALAATATAFAVARRMRR